MKAIGAGHARAHRRCRWATCCSRCRVRMASRRRRCMRCAPLLTRRPGVAPSAAHAFCWIVDFPLFEQDPATGERIFVHHPFTSPHPEDIAVPRQRSVPLPRAALRRGVQRQRAGQRLHPHHRPGAAAEDLRPARHRARGDPPPVRVPARRPGRGCATARRLRDRLRPHRDAARRGVLTARRDRVPEDDRGPCAVRGRADTGARSASLRCTAPSTEA